MMNKLQTCLRASLFLFLLCCLPATAQDSKTFEGLEFRSVGPATTSGRIADIAIHPENENIWYVAVGSGGVWKTENAGTTWKPIFDDQSSYSIGSIAIDPNNPERIWVGTGENVGGRHIAFGDGIYLSENGGDSWKNMGLENSEHLSTIIVHPDNSDVVWVASQGPLWSKGGQRGLYKTTDGGATWTRTLGDDAWTGVTDIVINPEDPSVLYAATWDRHRTVAAYMGGGPGTALYKSTDGGDTWEKLEKGIPSSNLGKIGLAISPFDPNTIYAAIELDRRTGGLFISRDAGASWEKQSDAVSGGTGPHYYQELYASPHQEGRLYLMNNYVLISDDHGKNFTRMNEDKKHVDSHAMAFKPSDPDYVLFGTDGGLYESYDLTKTWRYFPNLPITQYYKVAVDDAKPFYHIYGGTQDNGSHGGPSQTISEAGIPNSEWWKTLGADGHQSATEPGNPDITYGEFQQGVLWRIDQTTGETVYIQPQPAEGDPHERFNWDAPILVSPHKPSRIYFGSYRVWKSENRGDEWTAVSGDLTRNEERLELPILGRQQSWDNGWDVYAMSEYNTITSLAESPVQEGVLYAGTDDGLLSVSEDGGANWRTVKLGSIRGVPERAFVNDVRADLYDAGTVYLVLDNHKEGDYRPFLLKSTDYGRTWSSINGNLPKKLLTWRIVQDHEEKDLLFAATEYGIYMTRDGGSNWIQLKGGLPTISFRDITIQRDEDDLVGASFGRGFYILDDIEPLRSYDASKSGETQMFPVADAHLYVQRDGMDSQGNTHYTGENPPYGAVITYYLPEKMSTLKEERQEREKKIPAGENVPFPGWDALAEETTQQEPGLYILIKDENGNAVNMVKAKNKKGFNRVAWNLRHADRSGVSLDAPERENRWNWRSYMVTPGTYTATLHSWKDGAMEQIAGPQSFEVKPLFEGALPKKPASEIDAFREDLQEFQQEMAAVRSNLQQSSKTVNAMQRALSSAEKPTPQLYSKVYQAASELAALTTILEGNPAKNEVGERNPPSPGEALSVGSRALGNTYGPTANHKKAVARGKKQLAEVKSRLKQLTQTTIPALERELKQAGAPYIEGQSLRD